MLVAVLIIVIFILAVLVVMMSHVILCLNEKIEALETSLAVYLDIIHDTEAKWKEHWNANHLR